MKNRQNILHLMDDAQHRYTQCSVQFHAYSCPSRQKSFRPTEFYTLGKKMNGEDNVPMNQTNPNGGQPGNLVNMSI